MTNHEDRLRAITRRHFFCQCGTGIGVMALASLLRQGDILAATPKTIGDAANPLAPRPPHFPAKATRIIYLFMAGAPSQLDLFDYKPRLRELHGQPIPASVVGDQRYAFIKRDAKLQATPRQFARHGKCGAEISDAMPQLAKVADDLCIIRSMTTDAFNHAPAEIFLQTGSQQFGRPSMGSWLTYGLGSEAEDLPGFVVLSTGGGASGGASSWGSGFLPTVYQGVPFRSSGEPILSLSNPPGIDAEAQRESLDAVRDLNRRRLGIVGDPEIATRISAYEMAYRMQASAPELMDLSKETPETLDLYGAKPGETSFANNCLLARRLVERGVRFVNVYHHGWDHHGGKGADLVGGLDKLCGQTDRAVAGLIQDLKRRGLWETTLVVWGGEFGRTPMMEVRDEKYPGRDHHPQAFTIWMAGAGVKGGQTIGRTDDFGFHVIEDRVHIHDLQATILHLMGIDHTKLTYRFQGRDFRLTDVSGEVVRKALG
jgi:uncharacterized protein (DUF1501 family)